ncbi:hypothetical protein FKP32DRAFT_1674503 [Trametes sanguinea]|nr:hypothetical protein FKP32DRAFT_1674503 [Trametes sanguinea]
MSCRSTFPGPFCAEIGFNESHTSWLFGKPTYVLLRQKLGQRDGAGAQPNPPDAEHDERAGTEREPQRDPNPQCERDSPRTRARACAGARPATPSGAEPSHARRTPTPSSPPVHTPLDDAPFRFEPGGVQGMPPNTLDELSHLTDHERTQIRILRNERAADEMRVRIIRQRIQAEMDILDELEVNVRTQEQLLELRAPRAERDFDDARIHVLLRRIEHSQEVERKLLGQEYGPEDYEE